MGPDGRLCEWILRQVIPIEGLSLHRFSVLISDGRDLDKLIMLEAVGFCIENIEVLLEPFLQQPSSLNSFIHQLLCHPLSPQGFGMFSVPNVWDLE